MSDDRRRAVLDATAELTGDLRAWLEWQGELGAEALPLAPPVAAAAAAPAPPRPPAPVAARPHQPRPAAPAPPRSAPPRSAPQPIRPDLPPIAASGESLAAIRGDLGECTRCQLSQGRRNIVFGVGSPQARVVVVGEAPGRDEDMTGEPFVGRAGRLLTRMLAAIGIAREEAYICNVLKCRPPNNRDPLANEVSICSPFMTRQVQAIAPAVIVTAGLFASQSVLGLEMSMGSMRGTIRSFQGVPVVPMYHPAYLLRNPVAKRAAWADLLVVKQLLREAPPSAPPA